MGFGLHTNSKTNKYELVCALPISLKRHYHTGKPLAEMLIDATQKYHQVIMPIACTHQKYTILISLVLKALEKRFGKSSSGPTNEELDLIIQENEQKVYELAIADREKWLEENNIATTKNGDTVFSSKFILYSLNELIEKFPRIEKKISKVISVNQADKTNLPKENNKIAKTDNSVVAVVYWDEWLKHKDFEKIFSDVQEYYTSKKNPEVVEAIDSAIQNYIPVFLKEHPEVMSNDGYFSFLPIKKLCLKYILVEFAVMLLWGKLGLFNIMAYPITYSETNRLIFKALKKVYKEFFGEELPYHLSNISNKASDSNSQNTASSTPLSSPSEQALIASEPSSLSSSVNSTCSEESEKLMQGQKAKAVSNNFSLESDRQKSTPPPSPEKKTSKTIKNNNNADNNHINIVAEANNDLVAENTHLRGNFDPDINLVSTNLPNIYINNKDEEEKNKEVQTETILKIVKELGFKAQDITDPNKFPYIMAFISFAITSPRENKAVPPQASIGLNTFGIFHTAPAVPLNMQLPAAGLINMETAVSASLNPETYTKPKKHKGCTIV